MIDTHGTTKGQRGSPTKIRRNKERKEALTRQKQHDLEEAFARCEDWNVTGTYNISYPYVEKTWSKLQLDME